MKSIEHKFVQFTHWIKKESVTLNDHLGFVYHFNGMALISPDCTELNSPMFLIISC